MNLKTFLLFGVIYASLHLAVTQYGDNNNFDPEYIEDDPFSDYLDDLEEYYGSFDDEEEDYSGLDYGAEESSFTFYNSKGKGSCRVPKLKNSIFKCKDLQGRKQCLQCCKKGYTSRDGRRKLKLICIGKNKWKPPLCDCQRKFEHTNTCKVPELRNSKAYCRGPEERKRCTQICKPGFKLKDGRRKRELTCIGKNIWKPTFDDCQRKGRPKPRPTRPTRPTRPSRPSRPTLPTRPSRPSRPTLPTRTTCKTRRTTRRTRITFPPERPTKPRCPTKRDYIC